MISPLLRSPPFPWVRADDAAVSSPRAERAIAADIFEVEQACRLIRERRLGGTFWAPPAEAPQGIRLLLRPVSRAELETMLVHGRALGFADRAMMALLPEARWARQLAPQLPVPGVVGEVDPWSLLAPGMRLLASATDEWRLLAQLAGATMLHDADAPRPSELADALVRGVRYRDPFSRRSIDICGAIDILAEWRRTLDANRPIAVAVGMAWWKRRTIRQFFWTGRRYPLAIEEQAAPAVTRAEAQRGAVAVWPSRTPAGLTERAAVAGVPIVQVEDGFIRSIGLGADLLPPSSIVIDRGGIYYDPESGSDLRTILATADFPSALLERARALRETIIARGISKYGASPVAAAASTRTRRTILVAGQVEDDRSVRLGGGAVAGNLDLLRRARAAEPEAVILFKPHPDVDAGHRQGRVSDAALLVHADAIVRGEPMAALLARVDAVHVLTSQTGFEALLRNVETIVHGRPFFAGWGLTCDVGPPCPGRARRLTLDQLVAGTLILYPRYLDPLTGLPCPPEVLLERIAAGHARRPGPIVRLRQLQGRVARALGRTTG